MASTKTSKSATRKGTAKAKSRKEATPKQPARSSKQRTAAKDEVTIDRRSGGDRRKKSQPVAVERRKLQRREKVQRRRQIDPTTCERDYSDDEVEFMQALDDYKRRSGRMFPTCSEVLEVLRELGYQKIARGTIADTTDFAPQPTAAAPSEA